MTEIKEVFSLTKSLGKKSFHEILKESCAQEIIPIDLNNISDKKLIETITKSMNTKDCLN